MWNLSSTTRDWTHAPCIRNMEVLTSGTPGKSLGLKFKWPSLCSWNWNHGLSGPKLLSKAIGTRGFPGGSLVKNPPANAADMSLTPRSWRSPGKGNGNPLWYSSLGNLMDRGAWWATVHGVTKELDHNLATKASRTKCWFYKFENSSCVSIHTECYVYARDGTQGFGVLTFPVLLL